MQTIEEQQGVRRKVGRREGGKAIRDCQWETGPSPFLAEARGHAGDFRKHNGTLLFLTRIACYTVYCEANGTMHVRRLYAAAYHEDENCKWSQGDLRQCVIARDPDMSGCEGEMRAHLRRYRSAILAAYDEMATEECGVSCWRM